MSSRPRAEMIEATRAKLIASARLAFARLGYAKTSMDDLTAEAGLTRGALYHHFGDKQGLLAAVVEQIDSEMDARLDRVSDQAGDPWEGFTRRCRAYLEMAQEPEIRRIVLQDARAVLGERLPDQEHCIDSLGRRLQALAEAGIISPAPSQALARLVNGSLVDTALWIAADAAPGQRLEQALLGLELLLRGLRAKP
ncbi:MULTISPECIES: TetR/AcrR family transcriptional regulator [Pseudomonas]|uniref:TetR/AcrR family transcriptional regulator n=1 Tax=Pseudomonas piscis TaxID=2614538 RepID=A0ABY9NBJ3_9PSED|nr:MULTISPECIES: TetR/AcrR family transcriptional regulator [Pseudomonas]POA50645.1 TetR family transcriptional regulator [Pseudomonas sp. FW507-12TSA]WMN15886.1 TetR/AcrR family transcriptional regulator [Pseudomonas piscis]